MVGTLHAVGPATVSIAIKGEHARRARCAIAPVAVATLSLLLLIGYAPWSNSGRASLRSALLLMTFAPAIVFVPRLIRSSYRLTTFAGLAFLAIAAVSAALSGSWLSVFGRYGYNVGLLFLVALFSCWCLGSQAASMRGNHLITTALISGFALNLVVALVQTSGALDGTRLELYEGRAQALFGNPVHFAAIALGAFGVTAWQTLYVRGLWAIAAAGPGLALQLSGSRFALAIAALGVLAAVARHRSARAVALAAGLVAGLLLGQVVAAGAGGATGTSRAVELGGSPHARVEAWLNAFQAIRQQPFLGTGPGRFQAAMVEVRSRELARFGPDKHFIDAHNLAIEHTTTTGVLGGALFLVWVAAAFRRVRAGPLSWFAVGVLALHLVQPQSVATTPVAFIALGAAGVPLLARNERPAVVVVGLASATAALTFAGATMLLVGDALLRRAALTRSTEAAVRADSLLPPWPEPANRLATLYQLRARSEPGHILASRAINWTEVAAKRDPTVAQWWNVLAERELDANRTSAARSHFRHAIAIDQWSLRALLGLAKLEHAEGNEDEAQTYLRRARDVAPNNPDVVELADELGA